MSVLGHPRSSAGVRITAKGRAGHASQFIADTAFPKIMAIINRLLALRKAEEERLHVGASCLILFIVVSAFFGVLVFSLKKCHNIAPQLTPPRSQAHPC